jgi:hypothetical protein
MKGQELHYHPKSPAAFHLVEPHRQANHGRSTRFAVTSLRFNRGHRISMAGRSRLIGALTTYAKRRYPGRAIGPAGRGLHILSRQRL